ncbi:MAG: xanthine dehydrogenase accessory protein XdhC [Phycisphaerae bacterium]|nr:xanthine dehydrogenase accessory protein XdhC [Phycisphaerae bacterium]
MPSDADMWDLAARLSARGEPFVMLTVIGTQGSTPRDPGARMIWRPGAGFFGTVGGGQFEHLALASAERHFRERSRGVERFVLGAEAEQCCGGTMDVFLEFCGAARRLVIFGAGHVSSALVSILSAAALEIVVVDDRVEWNTEERFGRARRVRRFDEGVSIACERPEATLACVMTCSHDTDLELLERLLVNPPAFVGLIGSRSKRACLFRRLVASGVSEERVKRVHCPIGLGDMGKEPELIAVSMAGQILLEARRLGRL